VRRLADKPDARAIVRVEAADLADHLIDRSLA
jgi:hypothetical protein